MHDNLRCACMQSVSIQFKKKNGRHEGNNNHGQDHDDLVGKQKKNYIPQRVYSWNYGLCMLPM